MADSIDDERLAKSRLGKVIGGRYKLERVLGIGGMATVYAATDASDGGKVALKVLHPSMAANADVRSRFLREGYLSNKVGHHGSVNVTSDGQDPDGTVYLVMELLVGESLGELADKNAGKVPILELFRITRDLLDVLASAHEQGIVHRDLKPDNVFVTKKGEVKVLDFGVARMRDGVGDAAGKTKTGIVMGTPEYMPPEQARGRSEQVDGRTDLFAVGAMMFRLLTGRHAHVAETANEVLLLAMTEPAPKIATLVPSIEAHAAEVIDRAMAFAKEDRYADALAMKAAVSGAIAMMETEDARTTLANSPALTEAIDAVDRKREAESARSLQDAKTVAAGPRAVAEPTPSSKQGLWVHQKAIPVTPTPGPKRGAGASRLPMGIATVLGLLSLVLVVRVFAMHQDPAPGADAAAPLAPLPVAIANADANLDPDADSNAAADATTDADTDPDADTDLEDDDLEILDASPAPAPLQKGPFGKPPKKKPGRPPKKKKHY